MDVGGVDDSRFSGKIEYIDIIDDAAWRIPLQGVSVNGHEILMLGVSSARISLGSRTIAGPPENVEAIYAAIGGRRGTGAQEGYWIYDCNVNVDITFTFTSTSQTWSIAKDSFVLQNLGSGTCIGALIDIKNGLPWWYVSDALLTNVYTVFRYDNPPAVGFALKPGKAAKPLVAMIVSPIAGTAALVLVVVAILVAAQKTA